MNSALARGLAALGCVAAISATGLGVVAASSDDGGRAQAATVAMPSTEVLKYWTDAKTALSPLLLHVRQLPLSIKSVQDAQGSASDAQLRQAGVMAESFATARDLVGRIAVPATAPSGVGELLQVACQLYRQSALALPEIKSATAGPDRLAIAARAAALQAIGDRVFDQARRVLAIDAVGPNQAPVEYRYVPPVPAVADLPGAPVAENSAPADLDRDLRAAAAIIGEAGAGTTATPVAHVRSLRTIARALELGPAGRGEDVTAARLAISVAIVAEAADAVGQTKSTAALFLVSNDVWNLATTLNSKPHPAIEQLPAPKLERSAVWSGGAFDGRPPALKPGEDVGSGLPGGLPAIDPTQILKG